MHLQSIQNDSRLVSVANAVLAELPAKHRGAVIVVTSPSDWDGQALVSYNLDGALPRSRAELESRFWCRIRLYEYPGAFEKMESNEVTKLLNALAGGLKKSPVDT